MLLRHTLFMGTIIFELITFLILKTFQDGNGNGNFGEINSQE